MRNEPKEGSARYYEALWDKYREEQKKSGLWMSERKYRSKRKHIVPFDKLAAELLLLEWLLGSDLPTQLIHAIKEHKLINDRRRWVQLRGESVEIRMILGRNAQALIDKGWKADPAYAQIAWDCGIEAADFSSAKEQIRKAHAEYRAALKIVDGGRAP